MYLKRSTLERLNEALKVAEVQLRLAKPERLTTTRIKAVFKAQGAAYLRGFSSTFQSRLSESLGDDLDKYFDHSTKTPTNTFISVINVAVQTAIQLGAIDAIKEYTLGIDFTLKNPLAIAFLKDYAAERVTQINDTTKQGLRALIVGGADQGWSYTRIAKEIREQFEGFSKPPKGGPKHFRTRAELVASNELAIGYVKGNNLAVQTTGLKFEKKWVTVGDSRVTPECKANQAEDWIAFDADHSSGDLYPPRFPGCRCTEIYRRVD